MAIVIGGRTVQADDGRGYQPQGVNRPTQQQQNQYQQMAQSMADAGIRSLSGRTIVGTDKSGEKGSIARDIQRDFLYDKSSPGGETTPAEDMIDDIDFLSSNRGAIGAGNILETAGDSLKRSIVSNILKGKPPRETGIFGLDTSSLKLPSIGPVLGSLEGLKSTDTFFKNLATKGAEGLSSKDKVTLVNLVNRLGTSPESFEDLLQTYADKNEVPADDLFANFNRAYSDIQSNVAQSGVSEYFNRIGEIGEFDDSLKTMVGDLTGTRDTEGVITLENVTDNLGTEGLQFLKTTNPEAYYRLRPNDPDLANESFVSTGDPVADRRFNAKIMEARALAADKQSRQDANMGIMAASPALPGLPVTGPATVITPTTPTTNPVLTPVPVGGVAPTTTGITPFNINQFYASLPQYVQQGIMAPTNLSRFTDALRMFPGATV